MATDTLARVLALSAGSGGGGGEPAAYLKSASVNGETLTLTNKDDSTTVYNDVFTVTFTIDTDNIEEETYWPISTMDKTKDEITAAKEAGKLIKANVTFTGAAAEQFEDMWKFMKVDFRLYNDYYSYKILAFGGYYHEVEEGCTVPFPITIGGIITDEGLAMGALVAQEYITQDYVSNMIEWRGSNEASTIRVVNSLPSQPSSTTLYFITE